MLKDIEKIKYRYEQNICRYLDENVGEEVLSIVFMNLYPESGKRNKRSLAEHTSKRINSLIWRGYLIEIKNDASPKPPERNTPHGIYRILEHPRLVDEPGFGKGKAGEILRDPYNFDFTRGK